MSESPLHGTSVQTLSPSKMSSPGAALEVVRVGRALEPVAAVAAVELVVAGAAVDEVVAAEPVDTVGAGVAEQLLPAAPLPVSTSSNVEPITISTSPRTLSPSFALPSPARPSRPHA